MRWDLSRLYSSTDDLGRDLARGATFADDFAGRFRGKVTQLTPADLAAALLESETLLELAYRPLLYASLLHSIQSDDPKAMSLYVEAQEKATDVLNRVQ